MGADISLFKIEVQFGAMIGWVLLAALCMLACCGLFRATRWTLFAQSSVGKAQVKVEATFAELERQAKEVVGKDAEGIRRLVYQAAITTGFVLSEDTVDRVLQAEMGFRCSVGAAVTPASITASVNLFAQSLDAPSDFLVNEEQVMALIESMQKKAPDILHLKIVEGRYILSPIGGMFISLLLLRQGLSRPVEEEARRQIDEYKERANPGVKGSHFIIARQVPEEELAIRRKIETGVSNPKTADILISGLGF